MALFHNVPGNAQSVNAEAEIQIVFDRQLPSEMSETSGLFCSHEQVFTLNDSGNPPDIFTLNSQGEVTQIQSLKEPNFDFEALSGDEASFYVGDIGNNFGRRRHLIIRKIDRITADTRFNIEVVPDEYVPGSYRIRQHDFDAEAMVLKDQALWLFTKSWATGEAKVYRVDPREPRQHLAPVATITGLPGLVTGVDWDSLNQRFLVVGYQLSLLSSFSPFVAEITTDFVVTKTWPLTGYGQVEGVCVAANGDVWFSQEASPFRDSRLVRFRFTQ
ncbi:hypothetical protein DXV75_07085 [Alteromonas aestuariivivens]|uniref:Esterase-like activity of phytase family protein n=2 Tax=Alteromonas aestuariivivens TaxID=1938339 RepID=A0A3D8MA52_9ALTE|nr:hypothetical protein DXV75_07085 [Alteromonas aestuariivivens]